MRRNMDVPISSSHTKRFVIEDSITKVTSDGEPHEMMTMIAGLSGVVAAFIILAILISLIACKKGHDTVHDKLTADEGLEKISTVSGNPNESENTSSYSHSPESTIADVVHVPTRVRFNSVCSVRSGTLEGILNTAFIDSELSLCDSIGRHKEKMHRETEIKV